MIRSASLADAADIARVHIAAWRTTYSGIVAQDHIDQLSTDAFTARWEVRLGIAGIEPTSTVLVVTGDGDTIVGFASGGNTRDESISFDGELYAIYLLQEAQGRGWGRRLLHGVAAHLLAQGNTSLCVSVLRDNPARGFYEHLGAAWLCDVPHVLGGRSYQAAWYGWPDLRTLVDATS